MNTTPASVIKVVRDHLSRETRTLGIERENEQFSLPFDEESKEERELYDMT